MLTPFLSAKALHVSAFCGAAGVEYDGRMKHLPIIAAIALGGALGAVARWGISLSVHRITGMMTFPIGTFVVNLLGCVAIGFCYIWLQDRGTAVQRSFITVGLIGALTTFSTYSIESLVLLEKGAYSYAMFNIIASVVLGLGAAVVGIALGRIATGP